jgi:hypothetical protein
MNMVGSRCWIASSAIFGRCAAKKGLETGSGKQHALALCCRLYQSSRCFNRVKKKAARPRLRHSSISLFCLQWSDCPPWTNRQPVPSPQASPELLTAVALDKAAPQERICALAATILEAVMGSIIYLVGLIVVVLAILSFFGLH